MPDSPRDARRAELAALPDAELLTRCVSALEQGRLYPGDPSWLHWQDDCETACAGTGRMQVWRQAQAEVRRREQARRDQWRHLGAGVGRREG